MRVAAGLVILCCCLAIATALTTPNWTIQPSSGPDPAGRYLNGITALPDGNILVFGGSTGNPHSGSEVADTWLYHVSANIWEKLTVLNTPLPPVRSGGCLVTDYRTNATYLFGGSDTSREYNDVWRFDARLRKWTLIVPTTTLVPAARFQFGFVVRHEKLWVFGGSSAYGPLSDIWTFDFDAFVWTRQPFSNPAITDPASAYVGLPSWWGGYGAAWEYHTARDAMIVFGGSPSGGAGGSDGGNAYTSVTELNLVAEFQFNTSSWRQLNSSSAALPPARYTLYSLLHGDLLYVVLGWSQLLQIDWDDCWVFDLTTHEWSTVVQVPSADGNGTPIVRDSPTPLSVPAFKSGNPLVTRLGLASAAASNSDTSGVGVLFGGWGIEFFSDMWTFVARNRTHAEWNRRRPGGSQPVPRSKSTASPLGTSVYMFGGIDGSTNRLLNDVWVLDTLTAGWSQPTLAGGVLISARYQHAACFVGYQLYVHGGIGTNSELLDTMFVFDTDLIQWTPVTPSKASPPGPVARSGHSLFSHGLYLYLVMGSGPVRHFNDLWQYDTVSQIWKVIWPDGIAYTSGGALIPAPDSRSEFAIGVLSNPDDATADVSFAVYGGEADTGQIRYDAWKWVSNSTGTGGVWSLITPSAQFGGNGFASVLNGKKLLWHGGLRQGPMLRTLVKLDTSIVDSVGVDSSVIVAADRESFLTAPNFLSSHSAVSLGDGAYFIGGYSGMAPDVSTVDTPYPSFTSAPVYKLTLNLCPASPSSAAQTESDNCYLCSPGSYFSAGACVPCAAGTYQSAYGRTACTGCGVGLYSQLVGAQSKLSCRACPAGTYQNVTGQSSCPYCPPGSSCSSAATVQPNTITESETVVTAGVAAVEPVVLVQPAAREDESPFVFLLQVDLAIAGSVFVAFLSAVYFLLFRNTWRNKLRHIDLFNRVHIEMNQEQRWSKQWNTGLGGLISILFIVTTVFFIVIQCVSWLNAFEETRALIPNAVLGVEDGSARTITSDFRLSLLLDDYGDTCTVGAAGSTVCDAAVTALFVGGKRAVDFGNSNKFVESNGNLQCFSAPHSCRVVWTCEHCTVAAVPSLTPTASTAGSSIYVQLEFAQPNSFASTIHWNFTASSGVPVSDSNSDEHQISSAASVIHAPGGSVFRGFLDPTTVAIRLTQTLYTVQSSNTVSTGYHLSYESTTVGTSAGASQFQYQRSMVVRIAVTLSDTSFAIGLVNKYNAATFVAALLGSISGLFGLSGLILYLIEALEQRKAIQKGRRYSAAAMALPYNLPWASPRYIANHPESADWILTAILKEARQRETDARNNRAGGVNVEMPAAGTGSVKIEDTAL